MLCQLLSLDKRFHTINCFSFKNIDSHIKLENLINEDEPVKHMTADSSVINKITINFLKCVYVRLSGHDDRRHRESFQRRTT